MTVIGILEGDARPGTAFQRSPAGIRPPTFQTPFTTIKPAAVPSITPVTAPSVLPSWSSSLKPPTYKPPIMVRPDAGVPLVTIDIPKPPQMILAPAIRPDIMVTEWKPKETPFVIAPRLAPEIVVDVFKPPLLEIKPAIPTPGRYPGADPFNFRCRSMPWLPECRLRPGGGGSGPFIPEGSVPGTRPPDIVTPGYRDPPQNPPILQIPPRDIPGMPTPGPSTAPETAPEGEGGSMKWILPVGAAVLAYFFLEG